MTAVKCSGCAYADLCFPLLRYAVIIGYPCKQGRAKRRDKQTTLPSDTEATP